MTTPAPHNGHETPPTRVLCVALARRAKTWTLGCTTGHGQHPRARRGAACHQARVLQAVAQAKRRCGRPATAPVLRGSAAGRTGCGRQRFFTAPGLPNAVGEASALAGKRRPRRAKRQEWDVRQVVRLRRRLPQGARDVWPVVPGPGGAADTPDPVARPTGGRAAGGWVAHAAGPAPPDTAGVGAAPVAACADGGGSRPASGPAAQRAGRQPRAGAAGHAAARQRDAGGLGVGQGMFWRARVQAASRAGGRRRRHAAAGSQRGEGPSTRASQGGPSTRAREDHGVGREVGALPAGAGPAWRVSRALGGGGTRLRRLGMVAVGRQ